MSKLRVESFTISLDGFGAGPDQDIDNPLGVGGTSLHGWAISHERFRGTCWVAMAVRKRASMKILLLVVLRTSGPGSSAGTCWGQFGDLRRGGWRGGWGGIPVYHVPVSSTDPPRAGSAGHGEKNDLPLRYGWHCRRPVAGSRSCRRQGRSCAGVVA